MKLMSDNLWAILHLVLLMTLLDLLLFRSMSTLIIIVIMKDSLIVTFPSLIHISTESENLLEKRTAAFSVQIKFHRESYPIDSMQLLSLGSGESYKTKQSNIWRCLKPSTLSKFSLQSCDMYNSIPDFILTVCEKFVDDPLNQMLRI